MSSKTNGRSEVTTAAVVSTKTGSTSTTTTTLSSPEVLEKAAILEFKRSGDFDKVRRETLRAWESSAEGGSSFLAKLRTVVQEEVRRDGSLLARDRGKAATLLGGAVERTQLYPEARMAAAKNIFQTEAFRARIYESLKKYYPKHEENEAQQAPMGEAEQKSGVTSRERGESAQDAAMAFIKRESGT